MSASPLRVGARLRSVVCATEVIVVKAPAGDLVLECGGQPMVPAGGPATEPIDALPVAGTGTAVGKRYARADHGLEVLCVKAGAGTLAVAGQPLDVLAAKLLPASD